jgi:DNA-binding NarL/FixJ family response regulator
MDPIKVYLADDHTLFRKAFVKLLHDCKKKCEVSEAANGKELLALIENEIPDLVIVDLEMPVMGGIKVCEKISTSYPEVKIMVLSMHDEKLMIAQALQYGALAFVSKLADTEEFETALDTIFSGKKYDNQLMRDALSYQDELKKDAGRMVETMPTFSDREKMIIALTCKQFTTRQIALKLKLSEHTVRNHKVRIMRKVRVKNVQGLVTFALMNGLQSGVDMS